MGFRGMLSRNKTKTGPKRFFGDPTPRYPAVCLSSLELEISDEALFGSGLGTGVWTTSQDASGLPNGNTPVDTRTFVRSERYGNNLDDVEVVEDINPNLNLRIINQLREEVSHHIAVQQGAIPKNPTLQVTENTLRKTVNSKKPKKQRVNETRQYKSSVEDESLSSDLRLPMVNGFQKPGNLSPNANPIDVMAIDNRHRTNHVFAPADLDFHSVHHQSKKFNKENRSSGQTTTSRLGETKNNNRFQNDLWSNKYGKRNKRRVPLVQPFDMPSNLENDDLEEDIDCPIILNDNLVQQNIIVVENSDRLQPSPLILDPQNLVQERGELGPISSMHPNRGSSDSLTSLGSLPSNLSSNVLFGCGGQDDYLFAQELQQKFDRENADIQTNERYDVYDPGKLPNSDYFPIPAELQVQPKSINRQPSLIKHRDDIVNNSPQPAEIVIPFGMKDDHCQQKTLYHHFEPCSNDSTGIENEHPHMDIQEEGARNDMERSSDLDDETFARLIQEQLNMDVENTDEEYARYLQDREDYTGPRTERRVPLDDSLSEKEDAKYTPLRTRLGSTWNNRPLRMGPTPGSVSGNVYSGHLETNGSQTSDDGTSSRFSKVYSLPVEILRMDTQSIEFYRKILTQGKEAVHTIRVMVVGQFDVGKTALTRRLLKKHVDIQTRDSTNGIEVHVKRCKVSLKDGEWTVLKQDDKLENTFKRLANLIAHQKPNNYSLDKPELNIPEDSIERENDMDGSPINTHDVTQKEDNTTTTHKNDDLDTGQDNFNIPMNVDTILEHIKEVIQETNNLKDTDSDYADLSIWDFAGQYDFYATHQVFLSWRAVYLLVTDISKPLRDVVVEDKCDLDNTESKPCSVSEFVEFWLNSIHEYSSSQEPKVPPVILVGTHADKLDQGKIKELSDQYFDDLRKMVMDKETRLHLVDEDFTINNAIEDPNLTKLKDKIFEVASNQQYWGELIPARWITLEKAIIELRGEGLKICERTTLLKINQALPVPLSSDEEVELFLRFHHDSGNILYFSHEDLCDYILLDPQWLVDAFKCLITADMFLKKKPEYKQWLEFNTTGRLEQELIDAVWKVNEFHDHRDHLIALLERLDIIARPRLFVDDEKQTQTMGYFFAPSVLKDPPPPEVLLPCNSTANVTSRLCFTMTTTFVRISMFNRLMAACLTRWPLSKKGNDHLIFCGCGVFDVDNQHRLTLLFSQDVIQIWVTKYAELKPHPNEDLCMQVRTFIAETLTRMQVTSPFKTCIKCPFVTNVRSDKGMFDLKDLVNQEEVACHHHDKPHIIKSADMLRYWKFEKASYEDVSTSVIVCSKSSEHEMRTNRIPDRNYELKKTFNDALCQSAHDNLNTTMQSVGSLIGPNSIGTVFAVGKKYVMTAWHVVRDIIEDRFGVVDSSKMDQVVIKFNEDPIQQCVHQYSVKRDIPFVDKDLDVSVVEIKDPFNLPSSVLLCKHDVTSDLADVSLCGFGQPGSHKKHIEHGCQIIDPNSSIVSQAISHLSVKTDQGKTKADYYKATIKIIKQNANSVDLGYSGFGDKSKLMFNCFMENGASGSPVLTAVLVPGTVYAVGVMTCGIPQFYFELPQLVKCQFPDEYRFEMGAKMSHVYRSMCQKKPTLAQELFH